MVFAGHCVAESVSWASMSSVQRWINLCSLMLLCLCVCVCVGWLAGWLVDWLVDRSVGRLVGWLGGFYVCGPSQRSTKKYKVNDKPK